MLTISTNVCLHNLLRLNRRTTAARMNLVYAFAERIEKERAFIEKSFGREAFGRLIGEPARMCCGFVEAETV